MSAPEVKVRLTLDGTPEAIAAMHKFTQESQKAGKGAANAFAPLQSSLGGVQKMLGTLGVAFSVGAIVNFMKNTVEAAFNMKLLATQVGTTTGNMSALSLAANRTNTETKTMTSGLGLLGRKIDSLKSGAEDMKIAFGRIGLKKEDFPGEDLAVAAETVARAMDKYAGGMSKSAVAAAIMGRNGKALLPMFEEMVKMGGLAGLTDMARKTGFYVDDATVETFKELVQSAKMLRMEAMGASLEFLKGFGPQAIQGFQALTDSIDGGESSLENFGNAAGKAFRVLIAEAQAAWILLSGFWGAMQNWANRLEADTMKDAPNKQDYWPKDWKGWVFESEARRKEMLAGEQRYEEARLAHARKYGLAEHAFDMESALAHANVRMAMADDESHIEINKLERIQRLEDEAWLKRKDKSEKAQQEYLQSRNARIDMEVALEVAGKRRIQQELIAGRTTNTMPKADQDRVDAIENEITLVKKLGAARKEAGVPTAEMPEPKPGKQPLDLGVQKNSLEEELAGTRATNAAIVAANKEKYDAGLESLKAYYVARRAEISNNVAAELDIIRREQLLVDQEADPVKRAALESELQNRRIAVIARAHAAELALDGQFRKQKLELDLKVLEESAKLNESEENRHQQALIRIQLQAETFRASLVQQGADPAQAAQTAAAQAAIATANENFKTLLIQAQTELATYEALRSQVLSRMKSGAESQGAGETEIAGLSAQYLPDLDAKIAALRERIQGLGPDATKAFDELVAGVEKAKAKTSDFSTELRSGFTSALSSFFGSGINQAKNFGEAVKSLTLQIAQMIEQLLAARAAQAFMNWIWPAATVAAAEGGLIRGPGGPTDDRIPAMLSNREYVVPARVVALPGVLPMLESLRLGQLSIPNGSLSVAARRGYYAEGGLVAPQEGGGSRTELGGQITVALDEGLILRALESRAGQEALIRVTSKNRRAIGSALR
jgi:hypothetical protein